LIASIVGNLGLLISVSVFFLAFAYLATSASLFTFHKRGLTPSTHSRRHLIIPALGVIFSIYLITQCTPIQLAIGALLLLMGVPIYIKYSPKKELTELKKSLLSNQVALKKIYEQEHVFLAHVILHLRKIFKRVTEKRKDGAIELSN
jgi:APA family basic amino acid/polyamine antiporter